MLVDLSHPIADGSGAYPGLPPPRVRPILDHDASMDRYEGKAAFYLGSIEMATNTGTYLDVPFHRFPDGSDLASIPLTAMVELPGVVVKVMGTRGPVTLDLAPEDVAGRAVLIRTGWDAGWPQEEYWSGGPHLDARAVDLLVEARAALVGVDFANVDDVHDPARPAHTRLLDAAVLIVENLRGLAPLPDRGFRFTAAPPAVVRGASFPVRAFAQIP